MDKIIKIRNNRIVVSEVVWYHLIYDNKEDYWGIEFMFKNKELITIYITDSTNKETRDVIIKEIFEYIDSHFV